LHGALDGDRVPRLDGKYSAASGGYQIRRILQVLAVQNPTVSKIDQQKPKFGNLGCSIDPMSTALIVGPAKDDPAAPETFLLGRLHYNAL